MAASRQSVSQTFFDVISWRPVLEPVLRAFEPLLECREELGAELTDSLREAGVRLPEMDAGRAQQGASLLAGVSLGGVVEPLRRSAEKLLPLLENMESMAPHLPALRGFFFRQAEEEQKDSREALAEAVASGDSGAIGRIAQKNDLDPPVLEFVSGFIVSSVLRAMVAQVLSEDGRAPWSEGDIWQQGYCPVCGSLPSAGWLDKPVIDEKNAFLAGGGGKKHLHCGLCGANWKFRRGACPSCSEEGSGTIEMLRESGPSHGERLDWCTKCRAYCPTLDLREREFVPNLDAAAIGMMHLDMVAAGKDLRPLKPSFWNMF